MNKWRVDYAYRKNGKYIEDSMEFMAAHLDGAYSEASRILHCMAWSGQWDTNDNDDRFVIWNIGIMCDADKEVI